MHWPPPDSLVYVRSEEFNALLLKLVAPHVRGHGPHDDEGFLDAIAQVCAWFDERTARDRGYLAREYSIRRAFRRDLERCLVLLARRARELRRLGLEVRSLTQIPFGEC